MFLLIPSIVNGFWPQPKIKPRGPGDIIRERNRRPAHLRALSVAFMRDDTSIRNISRVRADLDLRAILFVPPPKGSISDPSCSSEGCGEQKSGLCGVTPLTSIGVPTCDERWGVFMCTGGQRQRLERSESAKRSCKLRFEIFCALTFEREFGS
jgi:hypothetical protein